MLDHVITSMSVRSMSCAVTPAFCMQSLGTRDSYNPMCQESADPSSIQFAKEYCCIENSADRAQAN